MEQPLTSINDGYVMTFSPDGHYVLASDKQGDRNLFDVETRLILQQIDRNSGTHFCADNRHVVFCDQKSLRVYDLPSGRVVREWGQYHAASWGAEPYGVAQHQKSEIRIFYSSWGVSPWANKMLGRLPQSVTERIWKFFPVRVDCLEPGSVACVDHIPGQYRGVNRDGTCLVTELAPKAFAIWNLNRWRPGILSVLIIGAIVPILAVLYCWRRRIRNRRPMNETYAARQ